MIDVKLFYRKGGIFEEMGSFNILFITNGRIEIATLASKMARYSIYDKGNGATKKSKREVGHSGL